MLNIHKLASDIKNDGKYDAILDHAKKALNLKEISLEEIHKLIENDSYYKKEYKDLNRWGELSSIHLKDLDLKDNDSDEAIKIKNQINKDVVYLKDSEEYDIESKNIIYLAWTAFIALPSIYVIDNMVRLFTDLYKDNQENSVYLSFLLVVFFAVWGFLKVTRNHKKNHNKYIQVKKETRELVSLGIRNKYFTYEEAYLS